MYRILIACAASLLAGAAVAEEPVLMSAAWAAEACEAWNADAVLTGDLAESGWIENDKGRGYKVMQVYRNDCGEKPTAELRVSLQEGKALCVYGGAIETAKTGGTR